MIASSAYVLVPRPPGPWLGSVVGAVAAGAVVVAAAVVRAAAPPDPPPLSSPGSARWWRAGSVVDPVLLGCVWPQPPRRGLDLRADRLALGHPSRPRPRARHRRPRPPRPRPRPRAAPQPRAAPSPSLRPCDLACIPAFSASAARDRAPRPRAEPPRPRPPGRAWPGQPDAGLHPPPARPSPRAPRSYQPPVRPPSRAAGAPPSRTTAHVFTYHVYCLLVRCPADEDHSGSGRGQRRPSRTSTAG